MNSSSAFCWRWERSRFLIVSSDCWSVCCEAGVTFCTSKTYQPNWVFTGPSSSPFLAAKIAESKAFSCWPSETAGSRPACDFDASSIEYCFTTFLKAARLERRLGLVGLGLGLGEDHAQVAALGLGEALLVLLVVRRDILVRDLLGVLGDLLRELLLELIELDPEDDVVLGHA